MNTHTGCCHKRGITFDQWSFCHVYFHEFFKVFPQNQTCVSFVFLKYFLKIRLLSNIKLWNILARAVCDLKLHKAWEVYKKFITVFHCLDFCILSVFVKVFVYFFKRICFWEHMHASCVHKPDYWEKCTFHFWIEAATLFLLLECLLLSYMLTPVVLQCKGSLRSVLIQNYFLKMCMLRFLRRS